MKVVTIVGARPQFIKAAAFSRAVARLNEGGARRLDEVIVHTGQHYDANMSDVFFEELGIPRPAHHLDIGSAPHGKQTGRMLEEIEKVLELEKPDAVLVYGDTNSTLAGALAAAKMHIPIAHVEAGLRSFNRRMPEEVNRVVADHLSQLLFCPTGTAVENLAREGVTEGVHNVGDVMFDIMLHYRKQVEAAPRALRALGLEPGGYVLATVHRAENTDSEENLRGIFAAFDRIQARYPVIVALHPRTRKLIETHAIPVAARVRLLEPVSYLEMIELEAGARAILTDSGGVQKEAYFVDTPCLTLREETEWVETVAAGRNRLCGASTERIVAGFEHLEARGGSLPEPGGAPYGRGDAAERIARLLLP
ncbi:MAG: non-hydrolyzing UDP-N-acetylglucosamine 2-epimerase [Usitatibacter sp.]